MKNRILIVDTIATNRIMLKVKLRRTQYHIDQAETAVEALALIKEHPYKLIIMSVELPDMNPNFFCRALRATLTGNHIPLVMYGTDNTKLDMEQLLTSGADEIFSAPIDANLLVARVRSLIRAYDELEELYLREGTKRALGFAEAAPRFETKSSIAFVGAQTEFNAHTSRYAKSRKTNLCHVNPHTLFHRLDENEKISAFIVDIEAENPDTGFDVLTELRSRSRTLRSARLARVPPDRHDLATRALDLGAHEVFDAQASDFEIGLRLARQLRHTTKVKALRKTLQDGVHAAVVDPLTGAFNRRYAMSHLHSTAQRALTTQSEFSVMMIDIDHFKTVNDAHGHCMGDHVLIEFSKRLTQNIRSIDLLARIGGEEFLIILPNCSMHDARYAAERLRHKVNKLVFCKDKTPNGIAITTSIGVAMGNFTHPSMSPDDIIERADTALYDAKTSGRDQISMFERSVA